MKLGTTTWESRNIGKTRDLYIEAKKRGVSNPTVSIIGPGGIVKSFSQKGIKGEKHLVSKPQRLAYFFLHQIESLLRKTNTLSLHSFETEEIMNEIGSLSPVELRIHDIHSKVLDAISFKSNECKIKKIVIDICTDNLLQNNDLVFAYNVIQRTKNPELALENIVSSMKNGGLLSLDTGKHLNLEYEKFSIKKINNYLFEKIDCSSDK